MPEDLLSYQLNALTPGDDKYCAMNSTVTKRMNLTAVTQWLYEREEDTASSIAAGTGLSIPTVTGALKQLLDKGVVVRSGQRKSSGGRRPVVYAMNYNGWCAIGIDVFRNSINVVLINMNAEVLASVEYTIDFENSREYWKDIKVFTDSFLKENQPPDSEYLGASFSLPCIFYRDDPKKVQFVRRLGVKELDLSYLYENFGGDTPVMNNGRLAGISAMWNRKIKKTTVYIMLNKEIGGAILPVQQAAFWGSRAGEFGHMTLVPGGKPCTCGKNGCFNAYCSASILTDASGAGLPAFFDGVSNGDERLTAIWEEYLDNLAVLINSIRMGFDCDVILGGFISPYIHKWESALREKVDANNSYGEKSDYLLIAQYGKNDSCVGAGIRLVTSHLAALGDA